jgi:hypothetical protein
VHPGKNGTQRRPLGHCSFEVVLLLQSLLLLLLLLLPLLGVYLFAMREDSASPARGRAMVLLQIGAVVVLGGSFLLWNVDMTTTRTNSSGGNIKERGTGLRSNSSALVLTRPFLDENLSERALEFVVRALRAVIGWLFLVDGCGWFRSTGMSLLRRCRERRSMTRREWE